MRIRCTAPSRGAPQASGARFLARRSCRNGLAVVSAALLSPGGVFPGALAAGGEPGAVPFTALHVYYISPEGNDRNAGTSPGAAWATPRHDVHCGDVILAEPGRYEPGKYGSVFGANNWGTVSNCPSTRGGIDGTGGIAFAVLLCAGPNLSSCPVNGGASEAIRVDRSHWAVEGFTTTQNENTGTGCMTATSESNDVQSFIAFINNIASTCSVDGFGTYPWTANGGVDQSAVVGAIAYNASPSIGNGICGSGVSMIPTNGAAATPGTHVFVAGTFAYKNINAASGAGCNTDGEGLVFDSWSCSQGRNAPYAHQGVAEQNVWWSNGSAGFEIFPNCQAKNGDKATIYAFKNTSYGNSQDPVHAGANAELIINGVLPTPEDNTYYSITKNIFVATESTCGNNGTCPVYAATVHTNNANTKLVNVSGNTIFHSNPGVVSSARAPNTDVGVNSVESRLRLGTSAYFPFGQNVYEDPGFANPKGLPTGAPDCADYTNTTACMNQGYHVAANLKPRSAAGYGYHPPGPCAPDPYFPNWLKGVVFLHWDGSTLTENAGLITKPCAL